MPLYEYKCTACNHRFERIVKFSDAPLTTCPKCNQDAVEQIISAPAIQFKGSGWYVSDYARKNAAGTAPSSSDSSSTSTKTESAPAAPGVSSSSDSGSGGTSGTSSNSSTGGSNTSSK